MVSTTYEASNLANTISLSLDNQNIPPEPTNIAITSLWKLHFDKSALSKTHKTQFLMV
jgi:hypothetical protein